MSFLLQKLRKHKLLFAFLPVLLFLFCSVFYYRTNHAFVSFTDSLFRSEITKNTLNLHYTLQNPQNMDIVPEEITFGSFHPEDLLDSYSQLDSYCNTLSRFSYQWLSSKNQLTYNILLDHFQLQLSGKDFLLYEEPLGPSLGTQAQLPILLSEYSFSSKKDLEDYLQLLSKLPAYYDSILQFEREKSASGLFMNAATAQGILDQCTAFLKNKENNLLLTTFNNRLQTCTFLTDDEKTKYQKRNKNAVFSYVFPAYQTLKNEISVLKDTGKNDLGLCWLPDGKSYYTYLVRDTTGCYDSVETIFRRIQKELFSDIRTLKQIANEHPQFFTDSSTLPDVLKNLPSNPEEILIDLQSKISEDFPALAPVSYEVKYVEKDLEDYLSPAFYLTAPLDNRSQNVIYINPKTGYDGLDLYTTLAHEGYPGHLYQTVYSSDYGYDPARSLLNFGGYVEGWATYAEMHSFSYGCTDETLAELYRINRSLNLGISSLLDILIHYYGYDREQTSALLTQFGFQGEETADAFFDTILEAPANYLKYYVGFLCFSDLKKSALQKSGASFSLKAFHKKILETGPCSFPILYTQVLAS